METKKNTCYASRTRQIQLQGSMAPKILTCLQNQKVMKKVIQTKMTQMHLTTEAFDLRGPLDLLDQTGLLDQLGQQNLLGRRALIGPQAPRR